MDAQKAYQVIAEASNVEEEHKALANAIVEALTGEAKEEDKPKYTVGEWVKYEGEPVCIVGIDWERHTVAFPKQGKGWEFATHTPTFGTKDEAKKRGLKYGWHVHDSSVLSKL
jgi:hypothetical protein